MADPRIVAPRPPERLTVRVYTAVAAERLAACATMLARLVFGMSAPDERGRHLRIDSRTGELTFRDERRVRLRGARLSGRADPVIAARRFLRAADMRLRRWRGIQPPGVPVAFFPADLRVVATRPVLDSTRAEVEHVRVELSVELATGLGTLAAPAEGASIEIGIDGAGGVVWMGSRWRPFLGYAQRPYVPFREQEPAPPAPPPFVPAPERPSIDRIAAVPSPAPAGQPASPGILAEQEPRLAYLLTAIPGGGDAWAPYHLSPIGEEPRSAAVLPRGSELPRGPYRR